MKCDYAVCNSVGAVFVGVLFIDDRVEGLAVWRKCRLLSESKSREAHHAAACWVQPESAP